MRSQLQDALQTRRLTTVTKALGELGEKLAYQLRPPYTEILQFKASEEDDRFAVEFSAKLHLHYANLQNRDEGLVFLLQFSGEASADSPNPPIHDLFDAGVVDSLLVYGYGSRWMGRSEETPRPFAENLDVTSPALVAIDLKDLPEQLSKMP